MKWRNQRDASRELAWLRAVSAAILVESLRDEPQPWVIGTFRGDKAGNTRRRHRATREIEHSQTVSE